MKQKYKYLAVLLMTLLMQAPSAHAQFNTIHEYGNLRTKKVQETRHKKNSQPTADSVMVDSMSTDLGKGYGKKADYSQNLSLPLKRIHITSSFGWREHPITKKKTLHNGIDLRASYENVYSILPGRVYRVGEDRLSGKYIIISSGEYKISYCHLSKILATPGMIVYSGKPIAISGNSGRSTGPHLHLTVKLTGKIQDPALLIKAVSYLLKS